MRTGVCSPSYAALATYAGLTNTNYVPWSQDLTNWAKVNTTVAADAIFAPDFTITADKLQEDSSSLQHYAYSGSYAIGNGAICASVWLKAAERSHIQFNMTDNVTGSVYASFDLVAGTITGQGFYGSWTQGGATIMPLHNGWYQCSVWGVKGAGTTVVPIVFLDSGGVPYAGTAGYGIYVWGLQVNEGLLPRPYIPTTATFPVTTNFLPTTTAPLSNLSDLQRIKRQAVWVPAGGIEFTFALPAAQSIDFLALVGHSGYGIDQFRLVLFSDASANPITNNSYQIHDSGWQFFWPSGLAYGGNGFVRPYLLPSALSVQSGYIQITSTTYSTGLYPALGGVEMGRLWQWTDTAVDREFGFEPRDAVAEMPNNVDHRTQMWAPRIWKGGRKMADQADVHTSLLDFQAEKGVRNPFVFVEDYDDPATWERSCFLARNNSLPVGAANDYPSGEFSLDLIEHMR